jgi:anti-anti-sigma regulatory factor
MTFQFEREGETGILTLTGSLTIDRANELRTMLLKNRKKIKQMVIKPVDVSAVDLTCLQILCSAHRLFVSENKRLSLSPDTDEVFQEMIERSGFTRIKACGLDLNSKCFWERGDA